MTSRSNAVAQQQHDGGEPRRSACVIILAAGKARRIGALSRGGKTHVRYRSAPALASQFATLARAGLKDVAVVCRPEHGARVQDLAADLSAPLGLAVRVLVQSESPGPGLAFARAVQDVARGRAVLLLLADTLVRSIPGLHRSWIAVAPPPSERTWCCVDTDIEGRVALLRNAIVSDTAGSTVAVGLYHFADGAALDAVAARVAAETKTAERELSEVLSLYMETQPIWSVAADEWTDLGDLDAITRATRAAVATRPPSAIEIDELGVIHKRPGHGGATAQVQFLRDMADPVSRLFPRVWDVAADLSEISMDYIALPTLAELYLYHAGAGQAWGDILDGVVDRVGRYLWQQLPDQPDVDEIVLRCRLMYVDKPRRRFMRWWERQQTPSSSRIIVNGREMLAGLDALDQLSELLIPVCQRPVPALVHGDLNFSNVLFDIESQTFRLIDPRGAFGGVGALGDARYDAAKLRHSYAGMFDAAMHGIFTIAELSHARYEMHLGPNRSSAIAAMDGAMATRGFSLRDVQLIEASLFLSMLPLHDDDPLRQRVLYLRGLQLLDAAVEVAPQQATPQS